MSNITLTENSTVVSNSSLSGNGASVSFDNLYPAIIQCFFIILVGYVAGRTNMLSSSHGKGIGTFVSTFCLPALLFKNMCLLNFRTVNWMFLLSILISKTVVFILVAVVTLRAKRPLNLGFAGIFAIFVTQSNDFALGYPILQALYQTSHPEYLAYIYLIAPISVMFLNPIGFAMLEVQKRKDHPTKTTRCGMVLHVFKGVVTNPLVFMTFIGIIGNFVFEQKIPSVLLDVLNVLGDAFNATALFYLGLSLVGKVQSKTGVHLVVPLLLIGVKTLFLPLITWQVVASLGSDVNRNDTMSLSMYGFLYGTFPTAPSVFLYASHYAVAMETIATGLVAGTVLSAPLMFISAKMMTVGVNDATDYKHLLLETSFSTSVVSVVCCVWVLFVLIFSRKFRKMPHQFLIFFAVFHMASCVGMIVTNGNETPFSMEHYVKFSLISIGNLTARCLTAAMSLSLYLIYTRSLCVLLRIKWWIVISSIWLPMFSVVIMYLVTSCHGSTYDVDPSFLYGRCQSAIVVVFLVLCSMINISCLVIRQRKHSKITSESVKRKHEEYFEDSYIMNRKTPSSKSDNQPLLYEYETSTVSQYNSINRDDNATQSDAGSFPAEIDPVSPSVSDSPHSTCVDECEDTDIPQTQVNVIQHNEQWLKCHSKHCNDKQKLMCEKRLTLYFGKIKITEFEDHEEMKEDANSTYENEFQSDKFIILLVALQISITVGLFLHIWRLFNNQLSGIYVEVEFLDCVLNYGQGFLVCALFGFDTKTILLPFKKRFRRIVFGAEEVHLPSKDDLGEDTIHLCHQFVKYHMENCKQQIVKNKKYRFREYKQVFTGIDFCTWLIEIGLATDRGEATTYGKSLLIGRVIKHVTSEHHFCDLPYFYKFESDTIFHYGD